MSESEFYNWFQTRLKSTENGCMEWTGQRLAKGYGHVRIHGKKIQTHRYVLAKKLGREIREGMCALHSCDNPPCCSPDHIWEGTNQDNVNDKNSKGRGVYVKGEHHGSSKLTESMVIEIKQIGRSLSQRKLASEYGVSSTIIYKILKGVIWSHVNIPECPITANPI
uniref:Uncharacterized protein n=1 Tax=viral metagenome TaxID=1070528 RepID=A0A6C0AJW4_9ZZZZ